MAIYFGSQKINAVVQPFISGVKTTQIGAVSNIRFSLISGKLKVGWTDPDDIYYESTLLASWKKTRLVYNAFPIGTEITYDSYPSSPDNYDGIVLESDWKNKYQYSLYECPTLFDTDKIYCFRFFTCNAFDNWSTDEKFKGSSIFRSGSETWKTLIDKLERFPEMYSEDPAQSVLPQPGGEIDLQYILNDQSKFTKVDFMNNLNTLTAVNAPFVILDYNATVPQYVKYAKENQDGSKTYKWVSSVDDSVKSIQIRNAAGQVRTEKTLTGDMLFRPIIGNCRVYDKLYDPIALDPTYVDTNEVVASSSYDLSCFEYRGNLSAQTINLYKAPMQIRIGRDDYKFVGYTMTIHSKSALYANGNTITFDQDEYQFASPYEHFDARKKYYWKDGTTYVDIDTTELIGKNITAFEVNGAQVDVWSQEKSGDPLVLETARYAYWKPYFKVTSGEVDPDSVVKSFKTSSIFKGCVAGEKVAYSNSIYNVLQDVPTSYVVAPDKDAGTYYQKVGEYSTTKMTPCYAWQQGGVYAANTYAHYNGTPWKVIKATTATLVGTPDTLTAYYQIASIGVKNSDWFVEGEKIPCDGSLLCIEQNEDIRVSYGNNLYQESNMRQWLNVAAGRDDDWFVPQNHFDRRVPKTNMYATSNFPLKLAKNDDFFENCIPAANMTRISDVEYQCRSVPNTTRYAGSKRQTVVMDKFFLLSYCEVGFEEYDAMNTFSNIYFNNASRIKYNMGSNGVISTSSAADWWLRYPYTGNSHIEYHVNTSGASSFYYANNSYGCVPACILG